MDKVTVFGSFIVDLAFQGKRLPVPGETVIGTFTMGPGGKGSNQAVAARLAGADVNLITMVGEDAFTNVALDLYKKLGMSLDYVYRTKKSHTGVASIAVEQEHGQNQIMVAPGAGNYLTREHVRRSLEAFKGADVFLTQFECNLEATTEAMMWAKRHGAYVMLNPAPAVDFSREILSAADMILPNETEAAAITGISLTETDFHKKAAAALSNIVKTVVITMGDKGVYCPLVSPEILPAFKVSAVDTTGAGDAFCGALAAALAEGKLPKEAIRFAQAAAALSVTKHGTAPAMPERAAIEELLQK